MRMNLIVTALGAALLVSSGALAGKFDRKDVGGDAKWVLHIDLEKIRASQIGDYIVKHSQDGQMADKLKEMTAELGFDPVKELKAVTAYGKPVAAAPGEKAAEDMVAVLRGTFDVQKLADSIRRRPGFEAATYGKHELLKVVPDAQKDPKGEAAQPGAPAPEPAEPTWVCLSGPGVAVIGGQTVEVLQRALDVLDGKRENLMASNTFAHLADLEKAPLFLAAANLGEMAGVQPEAAMLREANALSLAVRELAPEGVVDPAAAAAASTLDLLVIVDAKTDEAALQMKQSLDGIVALVKLNAQQQPGLNDLVDKLKSTAQGREVKITFAYPVKDLLAKIDELKTMGAKMAPPPDAPDAPPPAQ